jgi:hypothetical protein
VKVVDRDGDDGAAAGLDKGLQRGGEGGLAGRGAAVDGDEERSAGRSHRGDAGCEGVEVHRE